MVIKVCIGSACHLKGSYSVITELQELMEDDIFGKQIELKSAFCLGNCRNGVSVQIDEDPTIYSVTKETAKSFYYETVIPMLDNKN